MDTYSENRVRLANKYYHRQGRARLHKNEPYIRARIGFTSSRGLDFSGVLADGKYISIEIKETELDYLPMKNLRMTQVDDMELDSNYSENVFLLVCFKSILNNIHNEKDDEWYLLDYHAVKTIVDLEATSIPLRYFQAFGLMVPYTKGYPDYLAAESHPQRNSLKEGFPGWIKVSTPIDIDELPEPKSIASKYRDPEFRRRRIEDAIKKGVRSAERHEDNVAVWRRPKER